MCSSDLTRLDGSSAAAFVLQVTDVTDQIVKTEQTRREHAKLRSQARLRQVLVDEANAALQTHRKQLEELLAFAKVGAWELDVATGFMACTDQCKANMGLQPDDAIDEARVFEELMHVDDRDTVRAAMSEAIAGRVHFEVEYRVIWQDGTMRWLMSRGAARYLEDGSAQSLIGFTIDITARKASELHYQAVAAEEQRARDGEQWRKQQRRHHRHAEAFQQQRRAVGAKAEVRGMAERVHAARPHHEMQAQIGRAHV